MNKSVNTLSDYKTCQHLHASLFMCTKSNIDLQLKILLLINSLKHN